MRAGLRHGVIMVVYLALLCLHPAAAQAPDASSRLVTPNTGTAPERVRELWAATRPVILADAAAGLSDAEYLKRRLRVFDPWVGLQVGIAADHLKGPEVAPANKLIVEVLGLIDRVYGIPFYSEKKRSDIRARTLKRIEQRLAAVDRKVAGLSGARERDPS